MALKSAGSLRFLLAVLFLHALSACKDDPPPPDTTAPTTQAQPPGGTFRETTIVTLTCTDQGGSGCSATYYTTDGSTPTESSPRFSEPLAIAATTTLKFFSVDGAGNAEDVKTETYTFADIAPPTVSASPAGGTYQAVQTVTLTCNDGTGSGCASIYYTTDGSTPTSSSPTYTTPLTVSANTALTFFATDAAGNNSEVVTETYVIDSAAPTVTASPVGGTYNSAQSVTLTCDDGTGTGCASIRYTTDDSTPTASSPQYTDPLSISANTTLKFIGIDNAGNESAMQTESYVIDSTPPTVAAAPTGGTYDSTQSVTLTCDDGTGSGCASIRYTTDGSNPTASSPQYTAPVSISANTTLKFIGIDAAGNESSVHTETYVIDTDAPTVAASPTGGTYNSAQSVTLTCSDGTGSGCASIRYTTDGSNPTASSPQYTAALSITANTTLKFIGIDNAGNQSTVRTEAYVIDTAAPTVTASPVGGTYNSVQSVTLTCADGTGTGCASIRYTTDGSNPTASSPQYTTPISISANTTLKFIGIDNAGNQSTASTETYVIDTTPPTVAASPVGGAYNSEQSVTLTCDDGTGTGCASIRYTTDGSNPTASSPQYTTPISISANTTLKFIAIDNAGNQSTVSTETYVIDTVAPTVAANPVGGTYNTTQSVTLTCNDSAGSGCTSIRYTTDGSNPTASSPQYTTPISISANTTLKFIGIDNAGNQSAVRTEAYVIDTSAPMVAASPVGGTYNSTQTVTLTCTDTSGSGCASIHYTTDGSTPTTSSPQYTAPISISANTTLKFIGIDNSGNQSGVVTEVYIIDTVAPTVAASPAGGTYNSTQTVTLTCDDGSGTGCASIRYTTDGSTPTASSPQYTAPISISANITLKFIGIDNANNQSTVRTETYVIDTVAPTVAASPVGGTYNSTRSVTLTCNDGAGTGCASIRYTTDGSTPTASSPQYSTPISISANTTLKFIGIDNANNQSTVRTENYVIDTVAPTVSASPVGGTYNSAQSVTLTCDDGTGTGCASIRYTTDGSTPTASSPQYSTPLSISANTTLKFIGIDNAGNQSAVSTEVYVIDTVAPTVTASPVGGTYNSAQSVTLTCNDGTGSGCASIRYTTDGSTPTASSPQYSTPISISANTTLKFIGIDNAGNQSTVRTNVYVIDTVAPTVTASPVGGSYTSAQTVTLTCNDGTGSGCASIRYTTDGSTPTASSPQYTAPLSISVNTTLKFIGIDNAGNQSTVRTNVYVIDTTAPTTTATPAGGPYSAAQTVTLSCDDGAGGSGCAATYYTVDGTTPTTSSPVYTSPLTISANTSLRFFSVDVLGNTEAVVLQEYFIGSGASTSAQIAAVRAAANGALTLPIDNAVVTYLKPLVGTDVAGFFLQAQAAGPAIFVAVDPATLSLQVGDNVSLVATQKATVNSQPQVTAISGLTINARGAPVEPLRVDVSTVDLPANLDNYDSELISISGTLLTTFASAGSGHVSSRLSTIGTPSSTNLVLRVPTTVQDQLDLDRTCDVTAAAPLWRFNTTAQPSGWVAQDITILSCPAPTVLSAAAQSPTSVLVRFDRRINPASVQANGSQFTFNGLTASAATVQTRDVLVTTTPQTGGQSYTVTVNTSVTDTRGMGVNPTANTATFFGFQAPAVLRISEVSPSITGGRDLVELYVVQGGNIANFTLVQDASTTLATLPSVSVATGDIIVVHLNPDEATNGDAPASETTSKSQYPNATYLANYDNAWDILGTSASIGASRRTLRIRDGSGTTQDGAAFVNSNTVGSWPGSLQALQAEGHWLPADCGGVPCTETTTPKASEVSASWASVGNSRTGNSVQRVSATDTNTLNDWLVGPNTLGDPNP